MGKAASRAVLARQSTSKNVKTETLHKAAKFVRETEIKPQTDQQILSKANKDKPVSNYSKEEVNQIVEEKNEKFVSDFEKLVAGIAEQKQISNVYAKEEDLSRFVPGYKPKLPRLRVATEKPKPQNRKKVPRLHVEGLSQPVAPGTLGVAEINKVLGLSKKEGTTSEELANNYGISKEDIDLLIKYVSPLATVDAQIHFGDAKLEQDEKGNVKPPDLSKLDGRIYDDKGFAKPDA